MIDDYMKILSLGMIIPMTPKIVQKKLLYELLNIAKIKLSEEELKSLEDEYNPPPLKAVPIHEVKRNMIVLKNAICQAPQTVIPMLDTYIEHLESLEKKHADRR